MKANKIELERRPARERLLAAANELFYAGGTHAVGIYRVIERAGVAKASLYGTFGSKEELVRAYLAGAAPRARRAPSGSRAIHTARAPARRIRPLGGPCGPAQFPWLRLSSARARSRGPPPA